MARKPIQLVGPTGSPISSVGAGSRTLYDASRWDSRRPQTPPVFRDITSTLGAWGNRELSAAARIAYANCPQLRHAIKEISRMAIGNAFLPEVQTFDETWNKQAKEYLTEWHKICDIRGGFFDFSRNLRMMIEAIIRDRDIGIAFVETESEFPMIQMIPAHRIGYHLLADSNQGKGGKYDGLPYNDGVFADNYGRMMALRIYRQGSETPLDISTATTLDKDGNPITTADAMLVYNPDWVEQTRGISQVGCGLLNWQDLRQVNQFWAMSLKAEARIAVEQHTEEGSVDPDSDHLRTGVSSDGLSIYDEVADGAIVRTFRAGSGSKIVYPESSRPSQNQQDYWKTVERTALISIGWPREFYDPGSVGGANIRMIMELCKPVINEWQYLAARVAQRIDAWALAKAIKLGLLKENPEWYKVSHIPPAEMSVDLGYSAQIDEKNYLKGFISKRRIISKRGMNPQEVRTETRLDTMELIEDAQQISKQTGVSFDVALSLLEQRSVVPPTDAQSKAIEQSTNEKSPNTESED